MSVTGRLFYALTQRMRGSSSASILREIRAHPALAHAAVRRLQFERLSRLLAHAESNVPYYTELFRSLGITSADVRSLDDFARLPVLTKAIVRERKADLAARNIPSEHLQPHHSGGSTGVPLSFFHDRRSVDASEAGVQRDFQRVGWRPGDMVAFFWGWNARTAAMSSWQFGLRQYMRRSYQFDSFNADAEHMAQWVLVWRRIRPVVVHGYASAIARFAEFVMEHGIRLTPARGVFTTAEKLYAPQRQLIRDGLQCDVFDCYGSSEVRNIASECTAHRMHVNADFAVLEAVPTADPLAPQPFIVTSLWNYGMPFIRYVNEDCGRLEEGTCECGSGFPLMQLDIARLTDHFVLPGGRVAHGLFMIHQLYGSEGIASFQFHQTALDRIRLLVVPAPGKELERRKAIERAVTNIKARSGGLLTIEVEEVSAIPLTPQGKHRYTRSDLSPDAPGSSRIVDSASAGGR
jgi:phenylacetate-CoA ligase